MIGKRAVIKRGEYRTAPDATNPTGLVHLEGGEPISVTNYVDRGHEPPFNELPWREHPHLVGDDIR
jgi:hypothetical protein